MGKAMRYFTDFPADGFYVVKQDFCTENLAFTRGAVVILKRWGSSAFVRISPTGPHSDYVNYLEVEDLYHLEALTFEQASALTEGHTLGPDSVATFDAVVESGRKIVRPYEFPTYPV